MTKKLTPEEFVKLWQSARSIDEVATAASCTTNAAFMRARSYRARGIQLRRFSRRHKLNVAALAELARDLMPAEE